MSTKDKTIGRMEELSDSYIDACLCDESFNVLFISLWGRDTVIQELLGRLTLSASDALSLRTAHIIFGESDREVKIYFDSDVLDKRMTRSYAGTMFGSLMHLWLFDKALIEPDYANHCCYILEDEKHTLLQLNSFDQLSYLEQLKIWSQMLTLVPFPMLNHWMEPVMDIVIKHKMITLMGSLFGDVRAWRIVLKIKVLEHSIRELIQVGVLSTSLFK